MIRKFLFTLFILFGAAGAHGSTMEAEELIRVTTDKLLGEFSANRSAYEADHESLYEMVNRIAVPHFDFERMTKNVLGRHYGSATDEQRRQFTEQFRTLLVRTYSQALFQYSGEAIKFIPSETYRDSVIVREEISVDQAVPVRLEYFLAQKEGEWKVYDVRIDGISLVTTYRNSYNVMISRKGLPVLIADLEKKNSVQATQ
jgi:phospholipid transport system substrate-binding protein